MYVVCLLPPPSALCTTAAAVPSLRSRKPPSLANPLQIQQERRRGCRRSSAIDDTDGDCGSSSFLWLKSWTLVAATDDYSTAGVDT